MHVRDAEKLCHLIVRFGDIKEFVMETSSVVLRQLTLVIAKAGSKRPMELVEFSCQSLQNKKACDKHSCDDT